MAIKLREILFLGKQEKKISDTEKKRKGDYAYLSKQRLLLPNQFWFEAHKLMQDKVTMAQQKLMIVEEAHKLLLDLIADCNCIYQDLKQRFELVRELKKEIVRL